MTKSSKSKNGLRKRLAKVEKMVESARPSTTISVPMLSSRQVSRRRRRDRNRNGNGPNPEIRRISGNDIVASVSLKNGTLGKGIVLSHINPRSFSGSRLYAESLLWLRWRPVALEFRLVSSGSQLVVGRMGMGWLADANEKMPSGAASVTKVGTLIPNGSSHVSSPVVIHIPCGMRNNSRQWYMCDGDIDDSTHGALVAILLSDLLGTKEMSLTFQLELKWTMEFSGPDVPTSSEFSEAVAIDGQYPYYTTSVNEEPVNNKYIIVKYHQNGEPVQFTGLESDIVYQLPANAKLNYYDKDKVLKEDLKYGVRLRDYPYPTMVFFADKSKAAKYAANGDLSNCLQYTTQGDWCTPSNPIWTEISSSFSLVLTPSMSHSKARSRNGNILGRPPHIDESYCHSPTLDDSFDQLSLGEVSGETGPLERDTSFVAPE